MRQLDIQFHTILSSVLFSGLFFWGGYFLVSHIDVFMYKIITSLLMFIFYINILRLFIFEILNLEKTRASEVLVYFTMYMLTAIVIVAPFVVEPLYVFEVTIIRKIIIFFASTLLVKYFIYMVMGPIHDIFHKWKEVTIHKNKVYKPLVSVMIPAWNEEVGIINTIESILQSTYRNIEIIVINDGSTDDSDKIIKNFLSSHERKAAKKNIPIIYHYKENGGKGAALNTAVALSKGEILISIDADCFVEPQSIGAFVEEFKDPKIMAAVGNVKIGNKNSTIGIVQYLEFLFSFYFKRAESLMGSIYIIGGASGAFRKEVFNKIGGYSTTNITEDIELTVRIQDAGMKIAYVPDALVHTEGASDIESLKKQRLRWKRGRFQTFYQHYKMFFSFKKKHNKVLTLFVMPMAIFSEIQLLLEIPFIIFLYTFSIMNSDYTSLFSGVVVVGTMFAVQFMFYDKSTRKLSFLALAPIGWLLFYIATYVEAFALLKSIGLFVTRKELSWQKWDRKGVVGSGYVFDKKTNV